MFRNPTRWLPTRWLIVAGALVLSTAAMPRPSAAQPSTNPSITAGQIATRVQAFYDKAKTFQARFDQRYKIKAYDSIKESQGKVIFQKAGKMSWVYDNGNRVVSDGVTLKVYEKDKNQMYTQNVKKSPYPAALSFLAGNGKLLKEFTFQLLDNKTMKFPGGYVLLGTPIEATPAYEKLLLYVDASTFQVRRVLLIDAQRNTNRFDFSAVRVNEKLPAQTFMFIAPAGVNIVKP